MWRFLFIAFFFVHAAIHAAMWATPAAKDRKAPFDAGNSWLLGTQRGVAMVLALAAAVLLVAAGVGLWANDEWWRSVGVAGLATSFGLMVLYFTPWFLFIQAVNASLIVGLLWLAWPSKSVVGA